MLTLKYRLFSLNEYSAFDSFVESIKVNRIIFMLNILDRNIDLGHLLYW